MADCRITCIDKPNSNSPHEHITAAGNPAAGWVWPTADIVTSIAAKTNTFYALDPVTGKRADVGIYRERFIRTHADGDWNNNLLSLNQCPLR